VAISRRLGRDGQEVLVRSLYGLGWTYVLLEEFEHAVATYAEVEALLEAPGALRYPAQAYQAMVAEYSVIKARVANAQGQHQAAKTHASNGVRLYEQLGQPEGLYSSLFEYGCACLSLGEFEPARDYFLKALHLTQDWTTEWGRIKQSHTRLLLADVDIRQGQMQRARGYCRESLRLASRIPDRNLIAQCLERTAEIEAAQAQPQRAARLLGAAQTLLAAQGRKAGDELSLDNLLPGWRDAAEREAILKAFEAGKNMNAEQAVAVSMEFL